MSLVCSPESEGRIGYILRLRLGAVPGRGCCDTLVWLELEDLQPALRFVVVVSLSLSLPGSQARRVGVFMAQSNRIGIDCRLFAVFSKCLS